MGQFICKLYKKKETRILMNGLDAAGKTTILYFLKLGEVVTSIPTIGFNVETLTHKNVSLTTWDIGGRDKIRPLYRHYYPNTDAIMFVIDSSDRDRLEIVGDEITKMLMEQEIENVPCLILANKQDLKTAMSLDEIKEGLNYDKILSQYIHRKINIFGCSAVTEDGQRDLHKALDWLCDELAPPRSAWWTRTSDKPSDNNKDNNTDGSTKENTDDSTDTEKVVRDNLQPQKVPWSLGSYLKGTFVSFKSALPSLW